MQSPRNANLNPTAIIADDEQHLAQLLHKRLTALWPDLNIIGVARNGIEALEQIDQHQPDIAFLDIRMPGMSGLDVAARLADGACRVVLVTAYNQFAVEAFEHHTIDYLLKPVSDERLTRTIEHLKKTLSQNGTSAEPEHLRELLAQIAQFTNASGRSSLPSLKNYLRWVRASVGENVRQVAVEDVLYFRASDKYTVITAREQGQEGEFLIRVPISELVAELDPELFAQIHRSTIVNLAHVLGTRRDVLGKTLVRIREHRVELPVSRQYLNLFKQM